MGKRRKRAKPIRRKRRRKARRRTSRRKFKWPLVPKASTRRKFRKAAPTLKLLAVVMLGSLAYIIGTSDIPTQKSRSSVSGVQTKVSAPKKRIETPKPKPTPKPSVFRPKPKPAPPTVPNALLPRVKGQFLWNQKPKLVFVIDDIGHNLDNKDLFKALNNHVTYAVLPHLKQSQYFSALGNQTGAEVILHQPLETEDGTIPGPGLITNRMAPGFILERLNRNLESVPHHVGANNHMGSLGTTDPVMMELILKEFKRRGLFFLDSYTTGTSVILDVSREIGLPTLKRDVFLDNVDEVNAIQKQLTELIAIARKQGYGVGIGHDRKKTLTVLLEEIPRLKRKGFEIVSLAELLEYKNKRA